MHKIHYGECIRSKISQLQLSQSYGQELAQNCVVWNVNQFGHVKMDIVKPKRDEFHGREKDALGVHNKLILLLRIL